jgi:hypothetical protein
MPRPLRPRATAALSVCPATATDLSAHAVFGLEARTYRALLAAEHIPHARIGRRVVARVEDVLSALDRIARAGLDTSHDDVEREDDPQPETAAAVLDAIGKEIAQ